jgi:hypothetical protein
MYWRVIVAQMVSVVARQQVESQEGAQAQRGEAFVGATDVAHDGAR